MKIRQNGLGGLRGGGKRKGRKSAARGKRGLKTVDRLSHGICKR